ncbi:MAG TPA: Crp/Fnr family transcriptional regulator [Solirubrobacteraceae bacterium]|nr:Crp/Fnr family transcriptional regulator [Solirubrobacteraceae bacterium]
MVVSAASPAPPGLKSSPAPCGVVRLFDEDPELAIDIDPEERPLAARYAVAPVFELPPGPWRLDLPSVRGALGLVLLDGLVVVRLNAGVRAHLELVGPGDVIVPWIGPGPDAAVPIELVLRVATPVRLAFLDRAFATRIARWPEVHAALMQRLVIRSRRLSLQSAINSLARTDERLELTFWVLAFRFGRVTADGYCVRLRLSHARLAEMVAATRPSVSAAMSGLQRAQRLLRTQNEDEWLLTGSPPASLVPLAAQAGLRL